MEPEIVTVLEVQDPVEIAWAKAALEKAGIPFYVTGEEMGVLKRPYAQELSRGGRPD